MYSHCKTPVILHELARFDCRTPRDEAVFDGAIVGPKLKDPVPREDWRSAPHHRALMCLAWGTLWLFRLRENDLSASFLVTTPRYVTKIDWVRGATRYHSMRSLDDHLYEAAGKETLAKCQNRGGHLPSGLPWEVALIRDCEAREVATEAYVRSLSQ